MKRKAYCSMILIFSVLLVFASPSFSAEKPKAGKAAAPAKKTEKKEIQRVDTMIAVFDLKTEEGVLKSISFPLSESIRREVFKSGKWKLIDRGNMDKVLGEQKFSLSGCVAGQCIVEAGQMLGVGKMVTGSVSIVGKTYYLSLSLINASTGQIEAQSEDECKCEIDDLIKSSKRLINKLLDEIPSPQTTETSEKEPEIKEAKEPAIEFSLEEFEKKAKEESKKKQSDKAKHNKKTEQMKLAYKKVEEYEQKDISPELKANAWKYFAEKFKEDNPYSTEDDKMRQKAKAQMEYYTSMAKQPPQSPLTKGESKGVATDPTTGLEMVFVRGGCYQMGDTFGDGGSDEKPVHEVCVDDFYIGKYEVTQGQWKAIMGNNPSYFKACGDNCPVESVSWNDVQDFIRKLNERTKNNPQAPFVKGEFRLPTEAEWEYAARSGGKNEKWAGTSNESQLTDYAWYYKNSGSKTHSVGQKKPNGLGIYDMSGNVWEWVSDWYDSSYYKNSPKNNPTGPNSGPGKVLRGGSWLSGTWYLVASNRGGDEPAIRNNTYGFRLSLPAK